MRKGDTFHGCSCLFAMVVKAHPSFFILISTPRPEAAQWLLAIHTTENIWSRWTRFPDRTQTTGALLLGAARSYTFTQGICTRCGRAGRIRPLSTRPWVQPLPHAPSPCSNAAFPPHHGSRRMAPEKQRQHGDGGGKRGEKKERSNFHRLQGIER